MAAAPPPPARRATALVLTAAVLLVLLAAAAATAVTRPTQPGKLTLISTANGAALADAHGNPLYLRLADKPNKPGCTGRCARTFPPAVGFPTKARGVTGRVTHTPHRAAGSDLPQVIYARHPLYYYAKDHPKRPRGQNVNGFRLLAPDGSPLPTGEIGTATSRPEPPSAPPARPPHTTPPATHHAGSRAPGTAPTPPRTTPRPAGTAATNRAPATVEATAVTGPTAAAPAAPARPATPVRTATPAQTAKPVSPASPAARRTATRPPPQTPARTPAAAVGALQATPSGAASGGAVHPLTATTADRARATGATRISLAAGAAAAASAGALILVRRLRRTTTGGEH